MLNIKKKLSLFLKRENLPKLAVCFLGAFSFCAFVASSLSFGYSPVSAVDDPVPPVDPGQITLRLLDATAANEIDHLKFGITPTDEGSLSTRRTIADVTTSNATGYKLYLESNFQKDGEYTTNLVHTDEHITDYIPTSTTASALYWNYYNPLTGTNETIPEHGQPDKIGQAFSQVNNDQTPIDINVSVDTSITYGIYQNKLLFSAVGNPLTVDYNIDFAMDGGVPQVAALEKRAAAGVTTFTLPATVPQKSGFQFRTWRNTINEETFNPGDDINIYSDEDFIGDVKLVAEYDPLYTYEIAFDCEEGTGCANSITYGPTIETSYTYTIPSTVPEKTGYNFIGFAGSDGLMYQPGDTVTVASDSPELSFEAIFTIGQYSLVVSPNGGTWGDSTLPQIFTQDYKTTKTIAAPEVNAAYNITYEDNGQEANFATTPAKAIRSFTGWELVGEGSISSNVYTFGPGNGIITANYNTTSNAFALPAITKTGHTCKWAENTASGTQYAGGTSRTVSSDTTYYAICTPNDYSLTINPNGGKWNSTTSNTVITQKYDTNYPSTGGLADATSAHYTIAYNMGTTGLEAPTTPTSVSRTFTGWVKDGAGTWDNANKTFTFGAGNSSLTATWNQTSNPFTLPDLAKVGHTCKWHQGSATGPEYDGGSTNLTISSNTTYYAVCTINQYVLTINPYGGKWNDTTSTSSIVQDYNTTKNITDATDGPSYTISYDMGTTGITKPTTPSSVEQKFNGWTKSGVGTWDSSTKAFTFGDGDGVLTAEWDAESKDFVLPALSKTGYTCKWAEGSATGTQYNGGTTRKVTSDVTYYAICTVNKYTLTVNPNGGTWSGSTSSQSFTQDYDSTKAIPNPSATPTYTITYNANSQNATYTGSPTSVSRPFTGWSLSGSGSLVDKTYQYSAGNGALSAQYSTTSNSFTLPTISHPFASSCKWAEGSTSGTQYAGGTARTITGNVTYYAVCSFYSMQQMTSSICSSASVGTVAPLKDTRDNNVYTVRKLADGKCWMTQNLRLVGSRTLTSADSNVASNYVLPASSSSGWCDGGEQACANTAKVQLSSSSSYGAYYSWRAATAGTGTYSSGSVNYSVCPKGWSLPTYSQYSTLYSKYNSYTKMVDTSGPALVLHGYRNASGINFAGNAGAYWTRTQASATDAYGINLNGMAGTVDASTTASHGKGCGNAVRCVAQ